MCALKRAGLRDTWPLLLLLGGCGVVEGQGPSDGVPAGGTVGVQGPVSGPEGTAEDQRAVEELLVKRRGGAGAPFREGDYLVEMLSPNWTPWPRYKATPTPQLVERMGSRDSRDRQPLLGLMVNGRLYEGASGARSLMRKYAEEDARLAASVWLALTTEHDKPVVAHAACVDPSWREGTLVFCVEQEGGSMQQIEVDLAPPPARRPGGNTGVRATPVALPGASE